jgi:hypothetical protein
LAALGVSVPAKAKILLEGLSKFLKEGVPASFVPAFAHADSQFGLELEKTRALGLNIGDGASSVVNELSSAIRAFSEASRASASQASYALGCLYQVRYLNWYLVLSLILNSILLIMLSLHLKVQTINVLSVLLALALSHPICYGLFLIITVSQRLKMET